MTYTMKDSGIEWIGMIPEHWKVKRLKEIFQGQNSFFRDGDWIESDDISESGIKYLTSGNVGVGLYKEKGKGFISEDTFKKLKCSEVFPGDILISRLNSPQGRACIVPELNSRIVTAVDNVICRPNENYLTNFLVFLFSSLNYLKQCEIQSTGATMKRISRSKLSRIIFAVPPQKEQEAIASYLDKHVGNLDKYIDLSTKKIKLLEEQKTALIYETVTRGLNPDVKMKDSGIEWIGMIPEHWEVKRLKNVLKNLKSGGTPNSSEEKFWTYDSDDGIPWISIGDMSNVKYVSNVKKYLTQDGINSKNMTIFKKNTLIYSIFATLGKVAYLTKDACINQALLAMIFSNRINQKYAYYLLKDSERYVYQIASKNTQYNLNSFIVKNIEISIPPQKEQEAIASYLDIKCSKIEKEIELLKKKVELLKEYKTSLIFEVVTGKKSVI